MIKRNHPTASHAHQELIANGYVTAHRPPGWPKCWGKPGDSRRYAIDRETRARSEWFHIVDYPEMEQFEWMDEVAA